MCSGPHQTVVSRSAEPPFAARRCAHHKNDQGGTLMIDQEGTGERLSLTRADVDVSLRTPAEDDGENNGRFIVMSCRPDVVDAVVEVCGVGPTAILDEATLESLDIDSLDLIEIAMIVEEKYPIEADGADFEAVETFGAAVEIFDRLIEAAST